METTLISAILSTVYIFLGQFIRLTSRYLVFFTEVQSSL